MKYPPPFSIIPFKSPYDSALNDIWYDCYLKTTDRIFTQVKRQIDSGLLDDLCDIMWEVTRDIVTNRNEGNLTWQKK